MSPSMSPLQTSDPAPFLNPLDLHGLDAYLSAGPWQRTEQRVLSAERAGDGNMNLVLRLHFDDGSSCILKHARPWVEKYPQVAAPAMRSQMEATYYRAIGAFPALARRSARLLHADADAHILLLEDLGEGRDLSRLYRAQSTLDTASLDALLDYLSTLHHAFRDVPAEDRISNREMRALNAEHIFRFPYSADGGFDLDTVTPGLAALGLSCRRDPALQDRLRELEKRYLADGDCLLHGDYFPGSFLETDSGLKVIDPEFCFFGDAEFDVGVLLAHLFLSRQPAEITEGVLARYVPGASFSQALCHRYTGAEILRRLLGLAQLPLQMTLDEKKGLVERAVALLATE